jgi:hypothetical protein
MWADEQLAACGLHASLIAFPRRWRKTKILELMKHHKTDTPLFEVDSGLREAGGLLSM